MLGIALAALALLALVALAVGAYPVSLSEIATALKIGTTSLVVAIVGLTFVAAALLSLIRVRHLRWATGRDALFLVGQAVVFIVQLTFAIDLMGQPSDSGAANGVAFLVVICFVIGISRAWELIGGPSIGIGHEIVALVRDMEASRDGRDTGAGSTGASSTGAGGTGADT